MVHCMEMLALSALPYLQLSASASFYSLLAITKPFLHDIFFVKGVLCSNHVTLSLALTKLNRLSSRFLILRHFPPIQSFLQLSPVSFPFIKILL